MGFLLSFTIGLLAAIGILGFLIYWLCSRSNNIAVAKFINGCALALAHKPKPTELLTPGKNGEATEEARGTRKEKAKEK